MKDKNELNNFIDHLSREASLPRLEFEAKLKQKILNKNQHGFKDSLKHRFNNALEQFFFGIKGIPYSNFGVLTALVLFTGISLGAIAIYRMNIGDNTIIQATQVSSQETYLVLNNVLKNNALTLTSSATQNGILTEMLAPKVEEQNNLATAINTQNTSKEAVSGSLYNFYHTTFTKEPGPLTLTCSNTNNIKSTDNSTLAVNVNVRTETFEYTDASVRYLKIVNYNSDNSVYSTYITDNTGIIEFKTGDAFAIRTKSMPTPTITPSVSSSQGQLDKIYGDDVNVKKIIINGQEFYQLITTESNTASSFCLNKNGVQNLATDNSPIISVTPSVSTIPSTNTVYIVHTVDPRNNYQIIETSYYLDRISTQTLLLESNYTIDKQNLSASNALKNYFKVEIPVKIIEQP